MPVIELSAGPIEYEDTGGDGPVLVFTHGLLMDGSVWRHVVDDLRGDHRCLLPVLPLGGHRHPMRPDADLSLAGIATLIGEFVAALDLHDVTLLQTDWGGAQVLIAVGDASRIGRLVITSSEAFDNYPPGPIRSVGTLARIPGFLALAVWLLRFEVIRRAPRSWSWMSHRPVPRAVMDAWFAPATGDAAIRRDLGRYVTSPTPRPVLLAWAQRSESFDRPVLVVWATEDKMMPVEHGRRLARLFPNGRLVKIADSLTLIPEDQPDVLVDHVRAFFAEQPTPASPLRASPPGPDGSGHAPSSAYGDA